MERGAITPIIDRRVALEDHLDVATRLRMNEVRGKIVMMLAEDTRELPIGQAEPSDPGFLSRRPH